MLLIHQHSDVADRTHQSAARQKRNKTIHPACLNLTSIKSAHYFTERTATLPFGHEGCLCRVPYSNSLKDGVTVRL